MQHVPFYFNYHDNQTVFLLQGYCRLILSLTKARKIVYIYFLEVTSERAKLNELKQ